MFICKIYSIMFFMVFLVVFSTLNNCCAMTDPEYKGAHFHRNFILSDKINRNNIEEELENINLIIGNYRKKIPVNKTSLEKIYEEKLHLAEDKRRYSQKIRALEMIKLSEPSNKDLDNILVVEKSKIEEIDIFISSVDEKIVKNLDFINGSKTYEDYCEYYYSTMERQKDILSALCNYRNELSSLTAHHEWRRNSMTFRKELIEARKTIDRLLPLEK